ncbi:hypothetical protein B0H14DRAFT_3856958 [Mycena olivaceomarginata]|nr:hypothetical protein B0H14DRAFT_3856958 [Mycena olivaceomarginata]
MRPTAGKFRENLIPVAVAACDGSDGQKFDFISESVHNDKAGQTLIVSSLTNGCLSFDCPKSADAGKVTSSQLFPFGVCFVNKNGILSNVNCDAANPAANELFTIVA